MPCDKTSFYYGKKSKSENLFITNKGLLVCLSVPKNRVIVSNIWLLQTVSSLSHLIFNSRKLNSGPFLYIYLNGLLACGILLVNISVHPIFL